MHFSNKQCQRTRRPGCDAEARSRRIPRLRKHSSGNPRCRNASKRSLASHREIMGQGRRSTSWCQPGPGARGRASLCVRTAEVLWEGRYRPETNPLLCQKSGFGVSKKPHQLQVGSSLPQRSRVIGKSNEKTSSRFIFLCYCSISPINPSSGHCF